MYFQLQGSCIELLQHLSKNKLIELNEESADFYSSFHTDF